MRTRKMRLLSALLAVAMMFIMMPVGAFADSTPENENMVVISFTSEGIPDTTAEGVTQSNGIYNGTGWSYDSTKKIFTIQPGYIADFTGETITCETHNGGIIKGGTFAATVLNHISTSDANTFGTIIDGYFKGFVNSFGVIAGGVFTGQREVGGNAKIYGGIFKVCPSPEKIIGTLHTLSANKCTINGYIEPNANTAENTVYVVGEEQEVIVSYKDEREKASGWKINDKEVNAETFPDAKSERNGEYVTLKFKMPAAEKNVTIDVVKTPTPLTIQNGVPVDEKGPYGGDGVNDGWMYNNGVDNTTETNKSFVTENWFTADLKGNTVEWSITNNGTLKNGTINNAVTNNGVVKDILATSYFYNRGTIESGIFSRYASLGAQENEACWLTVSGGKVSGMQTAAVVGTQTVEVKANTSADNPFEGWTYSGDVSDVVAEQIEAQKNNETMMLTLNGNDGGTMVLTAKYSKDSFALTMLDGKATVGDTEVTAAVPGQTVTLSIDDSEIPEGMSFDHWVISPEVELEGDFKATDCTTSFTMPAQELTIYASLRTDSDDGTDAMTIVAGVAIGAGAAVLTYHIGTELYAKQVLGDGVAIPRTREDVALKAWELAGKPAVAIDGEPLSEAAQAEKWAVESGLMQNDAEGSFNGAKKMSKLKALRTLDAAKKLG